MWKGVKFKIITFDYDYDYDYADYRLIAITIIIKFNRSWTITIITSVIVTNLNIYQYNE